MVQISLCMALSYVLGYSGHRATAASSPPQDILTVVGAGIRTACLKYKRREADHGFPPFCSSTHPTGRPRTSHRRDKERSPAIHCDTLRSEEPRELNTPT